MSAPIVFNPDPVLRKRATPVDPKEIQSTHIATIISDMKEALSKEKQGVAIAAPQIGESLRIFVVAGNVYALIAEEEFDPKKHFDRAFINPEVISTSKKRSLMHEGCLSVKAEDGTMLWGEVPRAEKIKIRALDEKGAVHTIGASGFLAQIFQHEIDHLEGVLYIDVAEGVYEDRHEE